MLSDFVPRLSDFDQDIYGRVVPTNHFLRKVAEAVQWEEFREKLAPYYCAEMGRPAEDPVVMLKLLYLSYHHNLSDRGIMERARTDLAFRWFLQFPMDWKLPDPSSLCLFRGRLGVKGIREIFGQLIRQARKHGVVKDRLRIKDATHMLANLHVPTALTLVAQTRDKLLSSAEPFEPHFVEGERVRLEMLRETTKDLKPIERLATRVAHLRQILAWADEVTPPEEAATNRAWQAFLAQRELAHKILEDQEHPDSGDRTLSTTDPDARCGKHGDFFDGYMLDVTVDADSELIMAVNVLPGNGNEGADAVALIRQEEEAQGNDVQAISIDGAGFDGPLLRELQDPAGLNLDTYVPVPKEPECGLFTPEHFQEDPARGIVTCPAGITSTERFHDAKKETTKYRFSRVDCGGCPLLTQCMGHPPRRYGRTVSKSDYQAEHRRARDKVATPEFKNVRKEHPMVERKLSEITNRHGGRRARYCGIGKVQVQQLMACLATNVKRLVRLVCAPTAPIDSTT